MKTSFDLAVLFKAAGKTAIHDMLHDGRVQHFIKTCNETPVLIDGLLGGAFIMACQDDDPHQLDWINMETVNVPQPVVDDLKEAITYYAGKLRSGGYHSN